MRFEYAPYPGPDGRDIARPVIPITLRNPRGSFGIPSVGDHGLVDSGADYCVFSREIAELLELDLTAGERHTVTGVVAGESRPVYFHPIEIELGPYGSGLRLLIWAGFMPDLSDTGYGLPYHRHPIQHQSSLQVAANEPQHPLVFDLARHQHVVAHAIEGSGHRLPIAVILRIR